MCPKEGSTGFSRRKAANPTRVECQIAGQFPVTVERLKVVRRQLKWNNRGSYLCVVSLRSELTGQFINALRHIKSTASKIFQWNIQQFK